MTSDELVVQGKYYRSAGRFNEAYKCFLEAALDNNRAAIKNLGRCYLHGEGVRQDYDKSSYYFDMAKSVLGKNDSEYEYGEDIVDRRYNFMIGLEPMKRNVFKYIVEDVLKVMTGREDYLSVAYVPVREDKLSCVQSHPEENCDLHYMEIIISDESRRGFKILAKEEMSLLDTIAIYKKILIDYVIPDVSEWENVTEKVKYDAEDVTVHTL